MSLTAHLQNIRADLEETTKLGEWETTRANDVVIYDPNGFGAYRLIAHADAKEDATFIASAPATVARLLAAVEAVEDLARVWTAKGEHDMAYSKTVSDEDIAMELLTHGADMVEKARHIRAALTAALGDER